MSEQLRGKKTYARKGTGPAAAEVMMTRAVRHDDPVLFDAVEGSEPVPYYRLQRDPCPFILGDLGPVESMADAPACGLPRKGVYCEHHNTSTIKPRADGKPRTAKELARSLRGFI